MKAISVRPRQSWPEGSDIPAGGNVQERPRKTLARDEERITSSDTNFSIVPTIASQKSGVSTDRGRAPNELSVRAENILKVLAAEVTGENPPRGRWTPSNALLKKLTYRHISTARNCGPQATAEIVKWAESRGTVIRPPFHAGKSLSAMWRDVIERFPTSDVSRVEVAEALENSVRRRSTRIPLEFQQILIKLVRSSD